VADEKQGPRSTTRSQQPRKENQQERSTTEEQDKKNQDQQDKIEYGTHLHRL
jgi:hypothetical protein